MPSNPTLAEAAELLARTWARRSAGERSAFIDALAATTSTPATPRREVLLAVGERAALSGAVAPRDLVRDLEGEEAAYTLDMLAPEFDRTLAGDGWTWTLRTGPRQETLVRLVASGAVSTALDDVADLPTDAAGIALRELVAGHVTPSALFANAISRGSAPATLVQALTWAAPLGGFAGDLAEARRRAHLAELGDSYGVLMRHGVFGREEELLKLQAFAETPVDQSKPVPLLPVVGIGGTGKSTLLAFFVQPYLDRLAAGDPTAPAVVVIDFDRVLFRVNAEVELSLELTRQLGCAAPVASADFSVLRYQTAEQRRYTGTELSVGSDYVETQSRDTSDFEYQASLLIQMHELQDRPVLLVLDTFEEWQRDRPDPGAERASWNDPEQRILAWIARLRSTMGLRGLRVVVSGRAEVTTTVAVEARQPLLLSDLHRPAALAVLGAHNITGPPAESLVDIAGSNPLTLRVAARFYLRLEPAERQRFLAGEADAALGLDAEMRRAVLYDRFLSHIDDCRVQRLAHPGLVLRRVTASLVRHVLAGLCGLGEIDANTAIALTEKLADEIWLVRRTPDGLRHQPDVRRAMLRMMSEDPEHAETARRIHEAAIRWYESGRDRELSTEAAEVESFYHRLMMEPGDKPVLGGQWEASPEGEEPNRRWAGLALALGGAVAELPAGVAAQVRVLSGEDLPDNEGQLLPDAAWNRWIARRGAALMAEDSGALALDLLAARMSQRAVTEEPAWLAQACSDTARWDDYWEIARRADHGASIPARDEQRSGRYAMLNALFSRDPDDIAQYDDHLTSYLDSYEISAASPGPALERLFFDLLCTLGVFTSRRYDPAGMAAPLAGELLGLRITSVRERSEIDLYPVDQVRRALTWIGSPRTSRAFSLVQLAGLFRPDPRWVAAFSQLVGDEPHQLEPYLDRLTTAASTARQASGRPSADLARPDVTALRTHELLGEWASRFARAWSDRVELQPGKLRDRTELIYVLRGDNPEMRPAIRLALAEAVPDDDGLRLLARIAQEILPIPATDLHPDVVPQRTSPDARKILVQLVEYVDRSGVMPEFLTNLLTERPQSKLLRRVTEAFATWDDAHKQMLSALAARLREHE
jgi:hypothetical protein